MPTREITPDQEQAFLKAVQKIHVNGNCSCSLSEIKGAVHREDINDDKLRQIRNHCVNRGYIKKVGKDGFFHILTENGEHATGVYR